MSWDQDLEHSALIGHLFLPFGSSWQGEFQINEDYHWSQLYPRTALTETGTIGVTWMTKKKETENGWYWYKKADARFFSLPLGTALTGDIEVVGYTGMLSGDERVYTDICASQDEFVVAWNEQGNTTAQRYGDNGSPLGSKFPIIAGHDQDFRLGCFSDGSFAVVWREQGGQGEILLKAIDPADTPVWPAPRTVHAFPPMGRACAISVLGDDGFQIAYGIGGAGPGESVWVKAYPPGYVSDGFPEPQPVRVNDPGTQQDWYSFNPSIGAKLGKTVVVWFQENKNDPEQRRIRGALFDTTVSPWQQLFWQEFGEVKATLNTAYPDLTCPPSDCFFFIGAPTLDLNTIAITRPDRYGRFVVAWSAVTGESQQFPGSPEFDVVMRCFNALGGAIPCGPDKDNDGILNQYDCDPLNRYLRYDLDQDEICDEITGGTEDDCVQECSAVYGNPSAAYECAERCRNLDNCPCLDTTVCPDDMDRMAALSVYNAHCLPYRECIDARQLDCDTTYSYNVERCHLYFANTGQEDKNGNDRGDRCESRLQGIVKRFYQGGNQFVADGLLGGCVGDTYEIEVALEGGWTKTYPSFPNWDGEPQRTTVGACGCVDPQSLDCATLHCPQHSERDGANRLAWWAIYANQAAWKPNVGEPDTCGEPECPLWIKADEPTNTEPRPKLYAINKYQWFTHDPASNTHTYSWKWQPQYYKNDDLTGKYVRVRVAWQDPDLRDYHYRVDENGIPYDPSEVRIAYSDDWVLMESFCTEGVEPLNMGIDKPEAHLKPSLCRNPSIRVDPHPYMLKPDATTGDMHLVTYGAGMRPAKVKTVQYSPGAAHKIEEVDAASASACMHTSAFGLDLGQTHVLFRFGGKDPEGKFSNALWIGFPTHPANLWLRAEEIYGPQAAEGPLVAYPRMVYHARGRRLILLGHGTKALDPNHIWTFDLDTGQWTHIRKLEVLGRLSTFSMNLDPVRNRAILFDGDRPAVGPLVYSLDLDTLALTEIETSPSPEGPGNLRYHGAYLEPMGQALYVYGGADASGPSLKVFRLDLRTWVWTCLGDGAEGPGEKYEPFVSYDRTTRTLWVAGSGGAEQTPEIVFWGYRDGNWFRQDTLKNLSVEDWVVEGTFDLQAVGSYPVFVEDTAPYPGKLLVAHLQSSDPNLGLTVTDSRGNLLGSDLTASTDNYVSFYAHSIYTLTVVPGPGFDPTHRPDFTVRVSEAALSEVASFAGAQGVNDLMVHGDVVYLVGQGGMDAVGLADPALPQSLGHIDIDGFGQSIRMCGQSACVAKTRKGTSLKVVNISDPSSMQVAGGLQTPGVSRSLGVKRPSWVYLSDGGPGVSIVDARDPAAPLLVDRLTLPGIVAAVAVSANRLYVATVPENKIRIYEITDELSPVLLGEFQAGGKAEAMAVNGNSLHLAEHAADGWQQCISGRYCPRGTNVEVYDVSDPASAFKMGEYDGETNPAVHMKTYRQYGLVRTYEGFKVYRLDPLP